MPQKDTLYGDLFVVGNFEANLIKKTGGTSSQFLKADGSVDSTAYLTTTPTLDAVTTAGNTTTNAITVGAITGNIGSISQFKFNAGAGSATPTIAVGNLDTGGKFAALLAGTSGSEFNFDNSGWFAIAGDSKSNYNSNNLGSGSETYYLRVNGLTGNVQIATTTDAGYRLDVNGTGRYVDTIRIAQPGLLRNADITMGTSLIINASHGGIYLGVAGSYYQYITTSLNQLFNKVQINYGTQLITRNASLSVGGTITATTALAQGVIYDGTLVAAANNDVLVGLDINPTFTNGAFTGVVNYGLRVKGDDVNGGSGYSLYAYGGQAFIKGNWSITNGYNLVVQNRTGLDSLRVRGDGLTILEKLAVSDGTNKGFTVSYSGAGGYQFGLAVTDAGVAFTNGAAASRPVSFSMSTGEILRIHQSYTSIVTNNFLIGTTTDAGYKLDVNGTGRFTNNLLIVGGATGNPLDVKNSSSSSIFRIVSNKDIIFEDYGQIYFYKATNILSTYGIGSDFNIRSGGDLNALWIKSNGNILVGTSTDSGYRLDVSGQTIVRDMLTLRGYTGGTVGSAVAGYTKSLLIGGAYNQGYNSGNAVILHIADYSNDGADNVYPIYCEDENNVVDFWINSGNTGDSTSKKAYFGGNVGIGITNPTNKLQVVGNIALSGNLVPTSGTSTVGTFANRFTDFWGSGLIVGSTFYGDNYQTASGTMFFKDGGGVERMRMTSVGNFLIGTTIDPGYKLTVNGDINTSGVFRVGGVAGWTGVITIPTNPPGQQNVDVQGGIIVNVF